ncbi:MATE family efflux transporter [Desulfosarcina ovata subsp. sediminis]|uniref:Multidrug-efflux transporter n=1 Tax=Desulfosarcina ovata subsp. sediminis TaxID=885957 RepID=A0A5K7ZPC1_9BACT|nr:MATE family efflux transporter [Desulfosarcina ovata]BBO80730.1 MATE family efflux transporter [Desulfosarcina ovata subsp. sediminis]
MPHHPHCYRELFSVSLPLVFSMAATTVMEFTDRIFLANYTIDAIAAALPAGVATFLILTFFTGVTGYLNVFVAQYTGAGASSRIGPCIWQGIYFSALAAVVLTGMSLLAEPIFRLGGHPPEVQQLERVYFRILCLGGGINVAGTALACFFSGRGQTRPVMVVNVIGMLFNIPLDYALINGVWIFPQMGIRGAGIATVCAWTLIAVLFAGLIFTRDNDRLYGVLSRWRIDPALALRIVRKGVPAALQFTIDVFAFTFFIFAMGRLGKAELAISNIAFSLESIAFMPAVGFSMGLSTLVGQSLGRNDIPAALRFTRQTITVLMAYIFCLDLIFLLAPHPILELFLAAERGTPAYSRLLADGTIVLRTMAVFIAFDALYFTFIGVLKGAGDTRFIMWSIGVVTLFVMIVPLTVIIAYLQGGILVCWITLTLYVISLCLVSFWRFRQGRWKGIRVI